VGQGFQSSGDIPARGGLEVESERSMEPPSGINAARSSDPWAPYVPDDEAPWDLRRVVHLHRRAGFAATWGEIRRC
jgi:hypothetical protein